MTPSIPKSFKDIYDTHDLIKPHIVRTPVLNNESLNELSGADLYFKCENFQKIGAFKARGALNALLRLSKETLKKGVATHSSGNHAQALAYASKIVGTKATIVMPANSARIKIDGVRKLGGKIIFCEPTTEDRERKLKAFIANEGAVYIPPYNHEWIIAGQGTAAMELIEDCAGLDAIVAPVGGGGLISGTAIYSKIMDSRIHVFGAEPENLDDAKRSLVSGKLEKNTELKSSIADGLRTTLGDITFQCIRDHVQDILTVTEGEIVSSMKLIWQHLKITAEPSCAVTLAAILKEMQYFKGKKVGVIISGGNVDFSDIPFMK